MLRGNTYAKFLFLQTSLYVCDNRGFDDIANLLEPEAGPWASRRGDQIGALGESLHLHEHKPHSEGEPQIEPVSSTPKPNSNALSPSSLSALVTQ